jgi:hypothetical protein
MAKDVASGSQLAVARTILPKNRIHIRLFYQLQDDTLSQTKYESDHAEWKVSPIESESDEFQFKARPGSSLAAASNGGIRLFYQNTGRDIVEIQESDDLWTDRELTFTPLLGERENMCILLTCQYKEELGKNNLGENASISLVSWSKGGRHAQIHLYAVKPDKTLVMVTYDTKKEEWKETRTGKTAVEAGAVAAVGTPDGSTSVFYQPTQKVIAMYTENEAKAAQLGVLGIPTTRWSSPAWEGSLMPGSIQRKIVDQMDPQTRARFIQRLQAVGTQFHTTWDANTLRNTVQSFSDEFSLGLKWQSGQDWVKLGQTASSSGIVPRQHLLYPSSHHAYYICSQNSNCEGYLNIFLYADILYQLSRYVGLD